MQMWSKRMLAMAALGTILVSTGCEKIKKERDALRLENANLREQLASRDQALLTCEDRVQDLEGQIITTDAPDYEPVAYPPPAPEPVVAPSRIDPGELEDLGGTVDEYQGTITVSLASDILFDPGKAKLKSGAKRKLDRIASIIAREHPGKLIRVEGHTDSDPIKKSKNLWQDNWDLSFNRARSVGLYLTSRGVPNGDLSMVALADTRPLSSNKSRSGKAQNRRVEIVVQVR